MKSRTEQDSNLSSPDSLDSKSFDGEYRGYARSTGPGMTKCSSHLYLKVLQGNITKGTITLDEREESNAWYCVRGEQSFSEIQITTVHQRQVDFSVRVAGQSIGASASLEKDMSADENIIKTSILKGMFAIEATIEKEKPVPPPQKPEKRTELSSSFHHPMTKESVAARFLASSPLRGLASSASGFRTQSNRHAPMPHAKPSVFAAKKHHAEFMPRKPHGPK